MTGNYREDRDIDAIKQALANRTPPFPKPRRLLRCILGFHKTYLVGRVTYIGTETRRDGVERNEFMVYKAHACELCDEVNLYHGPTDNEFFR